MNKHIIADMVIEKLKKEIGIVPKPFPQELRILEAEVPPPEETLPGGKMRLEASLYQADKIKKIGIIKNNLGEISAGNLTRSYGIGVRLIGNGGFAARAEIGRSKEETVARLSLDQVFQYAKGGLMHGKDQVAVR